ncbi:MAG: dTDP-4-dehydrorhamnose 3,5-epimerase [Betaproteobacteria bacterium]|nr:dTDP-4-dehydrorhamnose 3,5-epimerase [Betaproteobacteria bacterium]
MKFHKTAIPDVVLIETQPIGDARGHFVRTFCAREMAAHGINPVLAQASQSYNAERGTLRGLHFQKHPGMEDKLVRCIGGAIFDVMVDLRPGSPTFGRWTGAKLSASNGMQLYAPRGFAHGFQALTDDVTVGYHIAQFYEPQLAGGVRFDDPDIGIAWPLPPTNISQRDLELPPLSALDRKFLTPVAEASE